MTTAWAFNRTIKTYLQKTRKTAGLKECTAYAGIFFCTASLAVANDDGLSRRERHEGLSYSYLGLGLDTFSYRESLGNFYGGKLESSFTSTVPMQRSGAYTSVNDVWGFAVTSLSSLFGVDETEDWDWSKAGTIQKDRMSLTRSELNGFGFRQFGDGHYLMAGFNYSQFEFDRSKFLSTTGTTNFNDQAFGHLPADQRADIELKPEANSAVAEESTTLNLMAGYGFDNYFRFEQKGWRTFGSVQAGLPVFRRVRNSGIDGVLSELFATGYKLHGTVGIGWQFSEQLSVNYVAEAAYAYLDSLSKDNATVPESTLLSLTNSLVMYWNF